MPERNPSGDLDASSHSLAATGGLEGEDAWVCSSSSRRREPRSSAGAPQAATSEKLSEEVKGHGFDADKLGIEVNGDKVKLSGDAVSQEEAEKIILALGNTYGVAEVDTTGLKIAKPATESVMYTV